MRVLCAIVCFTFSTVFAQAWSETRLYGGVICHEWEAASHLSDRLLSSGMKEAERSYNLLRALRRNREPQSLASHLKLRPLHVCECTAVAPLEDPIVLIHGRESIGIVKQMEQALPHPLYREWAYIRVVYHVSGLDSICEPLTN